MLWNTTHSPFASSDVNFILIFERGMDLLRALFLLTRFLASSNACSIAAANALASRAVTRCPPLEK
jgi:hypothetical protein